MAQKVTYYDDLTGDRIDEEEFAPTVLTLGGTKYEMDLGEKSVEKLYKALEKFTKDARKSAFHMALGVQKKPNPETKLIRDWAKDNGLDVSDRGRLAPEIVAAYRAKDPSLAAKNAEAAESLEDVDLEEL